MTINIDARNISKAYKHYESRWSRLREWLNPCGKKYHELHWILKNVNFTVHKGEAIGIIGVNGAGKSTLLKVISGIVKPSIGEVFTNGRVASILELGMGFHPDFTGRKNVTIAAQLLGYSDTEIAKLIHEIELFANIGDYFDEPVRVYSSGMMVRLAFSVATASRPEVLIVDEALAVGDILFQQKCIEKIKNYVSKGTSLLFVSHDSLSIRALCDRVLWLEAGSVKMIGSPKDVLDAYTKSTYSKNQQVNSYLNPTHDKNPTQNKLKQDCRKEAFKNYNLNNRLSVYKFDNRELGWGSGKLKITNVEFVNEELENLISIEGGENVLLCISIKAVENIENIFVGFMVRDRLGQNLFGDNSYLSTLESPVHLYTNETLFTSFRFFMPPLPSGKYTVTVAVASGTQENHIAHEWIDDALCFDSHNGTNVNGLVGVLMQDIDIKKI